jgi:hypothetical protein
MRSSLIAAILLATTAIALSSPQQLFGLWRFVGTSDSRNFSPRGLEREFRPDGILVETLLSSREFGDRPQRYYGRYKFLQSDRIICTYSHGGQEYTREQRFYVSGDIATFQDLGSGLITKMQRIQKSGLKMPKM